MSKLAPQRKRPRLGPAIMRGMGTVVSLASAELEADTLESMGIPKSEIDDAHKAVKFLYQLISWWDKRNKANNDE